MTVIYRATTGQLQTLNGRAPCKAGPFDVGSKVQIMWVSRDMTTTKPFAARVVSKRSREHTEKDQKVTRKKAVAIQYTPGGEIEEIEIGDLARHARACLDKGDASLYVCSRCGRGFAGKNAAQAYGGHRGSKRCWSGA